MKFKHILIAISTLFILASCGGHRDILTQSTHEVEERVVTVYVHDTIIETVKDSSSYVGRLQVDSTGQVTVVQIDSTEGDYLSAPVPTIKDNIIVIDCEAKAQQLFVEWKETFVENHKTKTITNTVITEVEKELSWWQTTLIWLGWIFIIALILIIVGLIFFKFK